MNIAQKILASAKTKINDIKTERKADVAAMKIAKKKEKAAYRKELISAKQIEAKRRARAKAKEPTFSEKVKKRMQERNSNTTSEAKNSSPFSSQNADKKDSPFSMGNNKGGMF